MGLATQDQRLARLEDVALGQWCAGLLRHPRREAHLQRQRVDEPGLPPGLLPHGPHRPGRELLAGLGGVLAEQGLHLGPREIPHPKRPGLDVEGAATRDDLLLRARVDAVVADVAHAAEHDALGKPVRALGISGAELPEHRHQRVAHHRVDLVDQQDQRRVGGPRPGLQERAERVVRTTGGVERVRGVGGGGIVKRVPGFPGDPRSDRPHRPPHVLARGLRGFHVDVGAAVLAGLAAVEQAAQRQQSGRLSRLAGRVQHEVALVPDELEHFGKIEPVERRDVVVARGTDRTRGVEFPHGRERGRGWRGWQGGAVARFRWRSSSPAPPKTPGPSLPPPKDASSTAPTLATTVSNSNTWFGSDPSPDRVSFRGARAWIRSSGTGPATSGSGMADT